MDRYFRRAGSRHSNRSFQAALGLAVLCLVAGCESVGSTMSDMGSGLAELDTSLRAPRIDLVAENKVVAQAVSGPGMVVSLPSVFSKRDDMDVFGTVTRKPDNNGPIPGFLDVEIRSRAGELIDQSLIRWVPQSIPTEGTRSARYSARILGVPPVGSIIRVAYVEKLADLDEPLGPPEVGGSSSSGGHGSGGGGHAFGSSSGRH